MMRGFRPFSAKAIQYVMSLFNVFFLNINMLFVFYLIHIIYIIFKIKWFLLRHDFSAALQELLRHDSHGLQYLGPAQKLMLLVSVGIPVGGVCALISNSKKASHRIYILFSGLLGCIGLACVAAFEHSSLLLLAMLITHMSGYPGFFHDVYAATGRTYRHTWLFWRILAPW